MEIGKFLNKIYYDSSNPAAYGSVKTLHDAVKWLGITREQVKQWLSTQESYSLHRPARRRFPRNKILASRVDEQWQADLVDLQALSQHNSGFKYLLTIVDVLSKYAWVVPLRDKGKYAVVSAFKDVFRNGRVPYELQTDKGTEFLNNLMVDLAKENRINHYTGKNVEVKCAIVERFNRTLKTKMFRYMTATGSKRYLEYLPKLVSSYNNTKHSTTKFAPANVSEGSENIVFFNTYGVRDKREYLKSMHNQPKFALGMEVRARSQKQKFTKGYMPNWTKEVFRISKCFRRHRRPMFEIQDSEGRVVDRRFHTEELQAINRVN